MTFLAYNVRLKNTSFDLLNSRNFPYGGLKLALSRRINILLLYTDCRGGRIAAIARHVSFAQITCHHGDAR